MTTTFQQTFYVIRSPDNKLRTIPLSMYIHQFLQEKDYPHIVRKDFKGSSNPSYTYLFHRRKHAEKITGLIIRHYDKGSLEPLDLDDEYGEKEDNIPENQQWRVLPETVTFEAE